MFDQQDPQVTWTIAGGLVLIASARVAYTRGKRKNAENEGLSSDSVITSLDRACDLNFDVGQSPEAGTVDSNLNDFPHVLIAGMTGSGKSTFLTAMLADLIRDYSPEQMKLVLMDPKRVELAPFQTAPHVLSYEWATDEMIKRLAWAQGEMTRRYEVLQKVNVRKIEEATGMPRIVIVLEEMANVMLSHAKKAAQDSIVNLASMGRAVGIHLVLVTQRPSVDVVTGLIKANVPARVALACVSNIDSRVILDQSGAENLMGRGDLLFLRPDLRNLVRLQGRLATDHEISVAVDKWK